MRTAKLIFFVLIAAVAAGAARAAPGAASFTNSLLSNDQGDAGGMSVDEAIAIVDRSGLAAAPVAAETGADSDAPAAPAAPLSYTPPPRTIDDITAILDQEKPDPAKRAALLAKAAQQQPTGAAPAELAAFYYHRGLANRDVGNNREYLADEKQARAFADQANADDATKDDYLKQLAIAYFDTGDPKAALDLQDVRLAASIPNNLRFSANYLKFMYALGLGRMDMARDTLRNALMLIGRRGAVKPRGRMLTLRMQGRLAFVEGRYSEAERDARAALATFDGSDLLENDADSSMRRNHDALHNDIAQALINQNRLLDAEAEIRIGLLANLQFYGKFAPETAGTIRIMSDILLAEGRYQEAERLAAASHDIEVALGQGPGSSSLAASLTWLARAQSAAGETEKARATFAELARIVGDNAELRHHDIDLNLNYVVVMLLSTRSPDAIRALQYIIENYTARLGERAASTAYARGWLGVAYFSAGDKTHAEEQFAAAMPILLSRTESSSEAETGDSPTDDARLIGIVGESYLSILAEKPGAAAETFLLADALRSRSVGQALTESAARAAVSDPAIANLARHEQDAEKQVGALRTMLTSLLSLPSSEQDPGAAKKLQDRIAQLSAARARLRRELDQRSPAYANFLAPKPATLAEAQKSLRPGEAMVAFYLGGKHLFAWAVPYQGAPASAATSIAYKDIDGMVGTLRHAVDPNAETLDDIPEFDVAQAYRLYQVLLQPVVAGWGNAQTLIVVPHRVLGTLPLSLLVTLPVKPISAGPIRFSAYKDVPFLARKVAVVQLPSVGALATLRALPAMAGSHVSFAGFGDPWFNPEQAREARADAGSGLQTRGIKKTAQLRTRGVPIRLRAAPKDDGAVTLAQLPRLPDTAEEVRDIATVLRADAAKDVFLGAAANVRAVRTMNLADRSVIVFATHGLVPGDLAGLTQPALALSAPEVAHVDGDGLLTVDKILGLKLNADWVVLSACNTAAGAGAGAEAVSGLGRAFFYAGARALLVSNWPVETVSARILTSDLFRRVAADAHLSRAEALRQAEIALIDGPGDVDRGSGETLFSYAHPIFWAPFAVVGDGGATIN